jgi:acyl-coenzyme A synthetase/AMP-(fatty) acid ligase
MLIERDPTTSPLSHSAGRRDAPLLELTIGEALRATVERFGDREALVVAEQSYRATYRELCDEVALAARGLLARGVRTGDRVGLCSKLVAHFPMTITGKVQKYVMREMAAAELAGV